MLLATDIAGFEGRATVDEVVDAVTDEVADVVEVLAEVVVEDGVLAVVVLEDEEVIGVVWVEASQVWVLASHVIRFKTPA